MKSVEAKSLKIMGCPLVSMFLQCRQLPDDELQQFLGMDQKAIVAWKIYLNTLGKLKLGCDQYNVHVFGGEANGEMLEVLIDSDRLEYMIDIVRKGGLAGYTIRLMKKNGRVVGELHRAITEISG